MIQGSCRSETDNEAAMVSWLSSCQEAPVGAGQRVGKQQLHSEDVWEQIQPREGSRPYFPKVPITHFIYVAFGNSDTQRELRHCFLI